MLGPIAAVWLDIPGLGRRAVLAFGPIVRDPGPTETLQNHVPHRGRNYRMIWYDETLSMAPMDHEQPRRTCCLHMS